MKLVSAFGVESELPVSDGQAVLPVAELPVYIELADGETIDVLPTDWGPNLARTDGGRCQRWFRKDRASGWMRKSTNSLSKIINGEYENWYWSQKPNAQPWMSNVEFPGWVQIETPMPQTIARVVVFAAPPWQWQGSLLDYELQYDKKGQWETLEPRGRAQGTFKVYTPPTRTSVDSFYSDRWVFQHHFAPVTTSKVRLLVHNATWGGGATEDVVKAGGQTGPHQIMLREVELYGR